MGMVPRQAGDWRERDEMTGPRHHSSSDGGDFGGDSGGGGLSRRIANDSLTLGLVVAVIVSLLLPSAGIAVGKSALTTYSNHVIFFIAGLRLRIEEVRDGEAAAKSFAWGTFSTLCLTPCLGSLIVRALPCHQRELSLGATILVCMPSAVSSSASLTIQARGNLALSVLLAVTCHALSVFTIPLLLHRLAGLDLSSGQLSAGALIWRLTTATLLPLLAGEGAFLVSGSVREWAQRSKLLLTTATNLLVVLTPWMHLSISSQRGVLSHIALPDLARATCVSLILPIAFFSINHFAASSLGLAQDYVKSVTIVTSSKTLPVAMTVLGMLPPSFGDTGLLALPGILIYFAHILICSVVTRHWSEEGPFQDTHAA